MPSEVHVVVVSEMPFSSSEVHKSAVSDYICRKVLYCVSCYHLSTFSLHLQIENYFYYSYSMPDKVT